MDGEAEQPQEQPRRVRRKRGWDDEEPTAEEPPAGISAGPPGIGAIPAAFATGAAAARPTSGAGAGAVPPGTTFAGPRAPGPGSTSAVMMAKGGDSSRFPKKDNSQIKKLCKFWSWGSCQRQFDCPFAHGIDELSKEGQAQEFNLHILVEAEKDAASKGDVGKKLGLMLAEEREKLAAIQQEIAAVRQREQEEAEEKARQEAAEKERTLGSIPDIGNRMMREEIEKKIAAIKAQKGSGKGDFGSLDGAIGMELSAMTGMAGMTSMADMASMASIASMAAIGGMEGVDTTGFMEGWKAAEGMMNNEAIGSVVDTTAAGMGGMASMPGMPGTEPIGGMEGMDDAAAMGGMPDQGMADTGGMQDMQGMQDTAQKMQENDGYSGNDQSWSGRDNSWGTSSRGNSWSNSGSSWSANGGSWNSSDWGSSSWGTKTIKPPGSTAANKGTSKAGPATVPKSLTYGLGTKGKTGYAGGVGDT